MPDALLLVSFGGPEGPDDVLPFLENVTRGRRIPPERLRAVGEHYYTFGGVSPINGQNRALVGRLRGELAARGRAVPVYWGNRNWSPYLGEVVRQLAADGVSRALAVFTSAYSSYSGCRQYRENLADAAAGCGGTAPVIERIGPYWNHAGFVGPFVDATIGALARLPDDVRDGARLVFCTHSLPLELARNSGPDGDAYVREHQQVAQWVAAGVAERTGRVHGWDLVFQSRSGPPDQAWLEPDVGDHLAALATAGVPAAVMVPIGFVSDHMEVVWDLDTQAVARAREVGLPVQRAATPSTDPRFVTMLVDLLLERIDDVPRGERPRLGDQGAPPDRCAAGCCPNPLGPRPAVAEDPSVTLGPRRG